METSLDHEGERGSDSLRILSLAEKLFHPPRDRPNDSLRRVGSEGSDEIDILGSKELRVRRSRGRFIGRLN